MPVAGDDSLGVGKVVRVVPLVGVVEVGQDVDVPDGEVLVEHLEERGQEQVGERLLLVQPPIQRSDEPEKAESNELVSSLPER